MLREVELEREGLEEMKTVCKTLKRIKFYKAGNLVVSEWRIHSPTLHCTDYPHSDYHSRDYNRLKIHKA